MPSFCYYSVGLLHLLSVLYGGTQRHYLYFNTVKIEKNPAWEFSPMLSMCYEVDLTNILYVT